MLCYITPAVIGAIRETIYEGAVNPVSGRLHHDLLRLSRLCSKAWPQWTASGSVSPLPYVPKAPTRLQRRSPDPQMSRTALDVAATFRVFCLRAAGPGTCTALVLGMLGCLYISLWFYARHLPERWYPGRFDLVGNSHQASGARPHVAVACWYSS